VLTPANPKESAQTKTEGIGNAPYGKGDDDKKPRMRSFAYSVVTNVPCCWMFNRTPLTLKLCSASGIAKDGQANKESPTVKVNH
jgi:hypothetical protein